MINHVQKALTLGIKVDHDDVWVDGDGDVCWIDGIAAMYLKDFGTDVEYILYSCRWLVLE